MQLPFVNSCFIRSIIAKPKISIAPTSATNLPISSRTNSITFKNLKKKAYLQRKGRSATKKSSTMAVKMPSK